MALIQCSECKKEISSEAEACIHCGYPVKNSPVKEVVVSVQSPDNSSKRSLGTFFIFLAIVGIIGGAIAAKPSDLEEIQERIAKLTLEDYQNRRGFEQAGFGNNDSQGAAYNHQIKSSEYNDMRLERHIKAACWFVPGGILLVTGLVLRAGGPKLKVMEKPLSE